MKKVLITGSKGMLASDIIKILDKKYDIVKADRDALDITDKDKVNSFVSSIKPDIIINCAAYTKVDDCETNRELALKVNSEGPKNLSHISKKIGCVLVHISTDYVFEGGKDYYREDDKPNPINYYGYTKFLGEKNILDIYPQNSYVIRTQWLYGLKGNNFIYKMIELSKKNRSIEVVDDQIGSPTYALDLAKHIKSLLEDKPKSGIYHFINEWETSWYEFTKLIFDIKNIDTKVIPFKSERFKTLAKRPKKSILKNTKYKKMRDGKEALEEFLKQI